MAAEALEIVGRALSEGRKKLLEHESLALLKAYGIPVAEFAFVRDEVEAEEAAEAVGYPVVVKVVSPDIVHKTDVGGVVLGLRSRDEVVSAVSRIRMSVAERAPGASITGFLIQKMLPRDGVEVIVGGVRDPVFGPVVMFGLGGVLVELFRDVSFRVAPVSLEDAREMMNEVRGSVILRGYRGQRPVDTEAIAGIIVGVSRMMTEIAEIAEMDINPVMAYHDRAFAVDSRFILA